MRGHALARPPGSPGSVMAGGPLPLLLRQPRRAPRGPFLTHGSRSQALLSTVFPRRARFARNPLLGPDGAEIGRIDDAVIDRGSKPPRVNGLVIAVQRRKVFVAIGRVGEIAAEGARLRRGSVNVRR